MPSTHHPRRLHPLLLPLLLLPFCTPHPHPTTPLLTNLSLPLPLSAGRDLECFSPDTPKAHPVNLPDCPLAIDLLYHDPTGVMTLQTFVHNSPRHLHLHRLPPKNTQDFPVPFAWQHAGCQVLLTAGADVATDRFRLADVIVKAMRIIESCPPGSKRGLGGLALVGSGKTFFVAVNGPGED